MIDHLTIGMIIGAAVAYPVGLFARRKIVQQPPRSFALPADVTATLDAQDRRDELSKAARTLAKGKRAPIRAKAREMCIAMGRPVPEALR